jgi:hypothetical protein
LTDSPLEIAGGEPECVRWVAQHVQCDLERVRSLGASWLPSRIIAGSNHPQTKTLLEHHPNVSEFEGFVIDRAYDDDGTLVVASRHFRGTMFGLLEISRMLGIDPLEYFTDLPPRPVDFNTLTFPIISPAPAFRYRGFFINQEDLLAGWKNPNGPIPLDVYDRIFLTFLRLGANMVLAGTYISPDSPILDLASRRGLVLAQHHFQVVGTDVARLSPREKKKYSFVRFPNETIDVWRRSIQRNRHRETIWSLGYRGVDDQPFWTDEPESFSDQRKGQVISEAIYTQLRLLREELGTEQIPCVFNLYRENQILYQKGCINVPESVPLVWCDNGYGTMESYFRDGYELWGMMQLKPIPARGKFFPAWPQDSTTAGGLYYHVSFYDGNAPNRVQYVSPARIQANFTQACRNGLNSFMLLNVGNIREFALGIAAVFDLARSPRSWISDAGYHRKFLEQWCANCFSRQLAAQVADVYEVLYDAHWWFSTSPGRCFGDNAVRWIMPDLISTLLEFKDRSWMGETIAPEMSVADFTAMIALEGGRSMARWQRALTAAEDLLEKIPEYNRQFFFDNVVIQARRGLGAVGTLAMAAQAVLAVKRGEDAACKDALARAVRLMDIWEESLMSAHSSPKWATWSKADKIVLPKTVRNYLNAIISLAAARSNISNNDLHKHLIGGTASV